MVDKCQLHLHLQHTHYEQTCKLDRKSTIIFKGNTSICSNVTNFYKRSGPCFYHPLFLKDSQERLTYIKWKIYYRECVHMLVWYVLLKWHFSGRTIHAHNVWCSCHSLATNATCLLFVTAQDKNSVNNLLFLLTYHNGIVETLVFWKTKCTITLIHFNQHLLVNCFLIILKFHFSFNLQKAYTLFYKHFPDVMT